MTHVRRRIIGLYSPAPQSGKSTVAGFLRARGWAVVPFAGPLKAVAATFLQQLGHSPRATELALAGDKGMEVYPGITARRLLQTLGTEWGRTCVGAQVWVDCWRRAVNALPVTQCVVADDVRFPNEARAIQTLGGEVWQVVRPAATVGQAHASEGGLSSASFDKHILNAGGLDDLEDLVATYLESP